MSLADLSGGFEDRVVGVVLASVPQRARYGGAVARRLIRSAFMALSPLALLGLMP